MRFRDVQSDRPTGRYERRSDAWLLRDGGGLSRDRFRDDRGGSALPWLLGIAANVLADTIRRNRIEASARQRMGLPLGLATEDGYVEVEDRTSPCVALERQLRRLDTATPQEKQ
jgi:DNA-directed RNA polymerase specialized sigma24 family protein